MNTPTGFPFREHAVRKTSGWVLLAFGVIGVSVLTAWTLFGGPRPATNRCPDGTQGHGSRCCPVGQTVSKGKCVGRAERCPRPLIRRGEACAVPEQRVRVAPASLQVGPGDWEAQGLVRPHRVKVSEAFWLDRWEVTNERWRQCSAANRCDKLAQDKEPGLPVTQVTARQAEEFCEWAGGKLPTEAQWLIAAAGPDNHRYPWGDTGAVCIKACWGLWRGPCLVGAVGPDLAGIHPTDRTAGGVQDMAGGVSEWVLRAGVRPVIHGGSWRTELAAGLRTWFVTEPDQASYARDDVGFRCAYDRAQHPETAANPPNAVSSPTAPPSISTHAQELP